MAEVLAPVSTDLATVAAINTAYRNVLEIMDVRPAWKKTDTLPLRVLLATVIVDAARAGERDPKRLQQIGLLKLLQRDPDLEGH